MTSDTDLGPLEICGPMKISGSAREIYISIERKIYAATASKEISGENKHFLS